jgi:hypothetical protein
LLHPHTGYLCIDSGVSNPQSFSNNLLVKTSSVVPLAATSPHQKMLVHPLPTGIIQGQEGLVGNPFPLALCVTLLHHLICFPLSAYYFP